MWIWGLILVAAAGYLGYLAYNARKSIQQMTLTETYKAADLMKLREAAVDAGSEGSFVQMVEVTGVVRTGPGGPLTSQATKTECVWHRHKVERKYKERYRDSNGNRRTRNKTETLTANKSTDLFYVEDDTGQILVHPTVVVDKPKKVLDDFREPKQEKFDSDDGFWSNVGKLASEFSDRDETIGFRHREWVLADGARVYILGEAADKTGELVVGKPSDGSKQLISTQSEEELSEQHGKQGALYAIGSGLAGVAGIVVLVIAAVQQLG